MEGNTKMKTYDILVGMTIVFFIYGFMNKKKKVIPSYDTNASINTPESNAPAQTETVKTNKIVISNN